jgi:hypothetical protein
MPHVLYVSNVTYEVYIVKMGSPLRPGEVATLFGRSRWAVIDWLKKGVLVNGERHFIGFRTSPGGHRELDPADVAKVLAAHRVRRTAEPESGT